MFLKQKKASKQFRCFIKTKILIFVDYYNVC